MLGFVRVLELAMDWRRLDQLESVDSIKLGIGRGWIRLDRLLPAAQSLSCSECY